MNAERERLLRKRRAYFLPAIPNGQEVAGNPGHYYPGIAVEGESGYFPTDWDYGTDRKIAAQLVDDLNARMGLSDEEVNRIILSSMYAPKGAGR